MTSSCPCRSGSHPDGPFTVTAPMTSPTHETLLHHASGVDVGQPMCIEPQLSGLGRLHVEMYRGIPMRGKFESTIPWPGQFVRYLTWSGDLCKLC